jgi:hypothetical protein
MTDVWVIGTVHIIYTVIKNKEEAEIKAKPYNLPKMLSIQI